MKSLMVFANTLLTELGEWCSVSTDRDIKTITERVENEGLSFLTITLADFGKSLEKGLAQGRLTSNLYNPTWGFKGGVPRFLGGFLCLIFDSRTGVLLEAPSVHAISAVRQFSLAFSKIEVECSDERKTRAIAQYLQCEQELRWSDSTISDDFRSEFRAVSTLLWSNLLGRVDRRLYVGDFRPKHGPGATADGLIGNEKYTNRTWTARLEEEFPFLENGVATYSQYRELNHVKFLEPRDEIPVKVIMVPKTLKTPRIIAEEPTHMQYMQQAIHELIQEEMRKDDISLNLACYDSQLPNQELARKGSIDGSLATLDLSEASDRVSNEHVRLLLSNFGTLFRSVDSCRSRKARVLHKDLGFDETIRLTKFASMGSALCFPIETLVFTTFVFIGIQRSLGRPLSKRDIKSFFGRVRVYGDDIIVPVEFAESVVETLHTHGYKVNTSKSFWTGKFRESCGKDYYNGVDVSIVKVRSMFPTSTDNGSELASTVALRNHLCASGYDLTVKYLDKLICSLIPFPKVLAGSQLLGRIDLDGVYDVTKVDRDLQSPLVKGVYISAPLPSNVIDGNDALLKYFLKRGSHPFADVRHLHRSGRPVRVDIKYGYARPY